LYSAGKRAAVHLLSQVTEYSPCRAIKILKMCKNYSKTVMPYTEDEALAFIVDTRMMKDAYHKNRLGTKQRVAIFILLMIAFVWQKKDVTLKA